MARLGRMSPGGGQLSWLPANVGKLLFLGETMESIWHLGPHLVKTCTALASNGGEAYHSLRSLWDPLLRHPERPSSFLLSFVTSQPGQLISCGSGDCNDISDTQLSWSCYSSTRGNQRSTGERHSLFNHTRMGYHE